MEEKGIPDQAASEQETPETLGAQELSPSVPAGGADPACPSGAADEAPQEEGPKAPPTTLKQRIAAGVAAVLVILITLAYIYSIYTGALFSR